MCPGARASRGSANSLHSRVLPHAAERRPARGGPRRPTTRKIGEKREIVPFTLRPAGAWLPWTLLLAQTPGDTKTTHRWPAGPRKGPAPSPAARRQGNARAGPASCRRGCGYQTRRPYRRNGPFPASGTRRRRPSRRELGGDVVGHGPSEPVCERPRTAAGRWRRSWRRRDSSWSEKRKARHFHGSRRKEARVLMGSAPSRGLGRASARSRDAPDVGPA